MKAFFMNFIENVFFIKKANITRKKLILIHFCDRMVDVKN